MWNVYIFNACMGCLGRPGLRELVEKNFGNANGIIVDGQLDLETGMFLCLTKLAGVFTATGLH